MKLYHNLTTSTISSILIFLGQRSQPMKTKNVRILKVRNRIAANFTTKSTLTLKVCKGISLNHNESVFKLIESTLALNIHKRLAGNHNESLLTVKV